MTLTSDSSDLAHEAQAADAGPRFLSVQAMRGISAVAVAVYHTHLILAQPEYGGLDVLRSIASKGWLGVNFFFVLSGFIIIFAHAKDIGRPERLPSYIWKRFSRVYPVYWIVLSLYLMAASVRMGHSNFQWDGLNILSAYLLRSVTRHYSLPLQVAWTLFYEVNFYVVFAVIIFNRKIGIVAFLLWMGAIAVANVMVGDVDSGMLHVWNTYFAIGAGVYYAFQRTNVRWGPLIFAIGLLLLFAMAQRYGGERVNDVQWNAPALFILAFPFALVLLGGLLCEQLYKWVPPRLFVIIGASSYSIYLVHSPVISILAFLNAKLCFGFVPPIFVFIIINTASVAMGGVFHFLVERPVLAFARSCFKSATLRWREFQPAGAER